MTDEQILNELMDRMQVLKKHITDIQEMILQHSAGKLLQGLADAAESREDFKVVE